MNLKYILVCGVILACAGPTGPVGPPGPQGPTGASGLTVTASKYCAGSASGYTFFYQWVTYSTGDGWVSCEVTHNTLNFGYSNSMYLKAGQASAANCFVLFDIDTPSSGSWSFARTPSERVSYVDPASASNGFSYTYITGECN